LMRRQNDLAFGLLLCHFLFLSCIAMKVDC
jgi:hypothetical protein